MRTPSDTLKKITELRHALHRHPDLSMQESGTMKMLQAFLAENTSLEICPREGWFYAVKRKQDGKLRDSKKRTPETGGAESCGAESCGAESHPLSPIAFRADMDALPIPETIELPYGSEHGGVSHKCGHDGHCAALCGLALELDRVETARDVYLIFQPGEEIGAGAVLCRELIEENGIGEIFAFHNLGGYPEGALVYRPGLTQPASEGLRIRLIGRTSHASAPEKGLNPAGALAEIALFAQGLPEQETVFSKEYKGGDPEDSREPVCRAGIPAHSMRLCTITGIRLGSGDFGISPGEGEICMTLRAEDEGEMKAMERAVLSFTEELAAQAGLETDQSIHDYFPETRNHEASLQRVLEAAGRLGIPSVCMSELWRASEDFGHYLKECPGAMFYIGNGENWPPLHTAEYDFNDRILETAVRVFLELAQTG